jgi:hypothetical protein
MERAVCVARIAEVFFFLALLQDDDALAELRGAVRGDEARDASPDHDHVVLDIRFGHRTMVRIDLPCISPLLTPSGHSLGGPQSRTAKRNSLHGEKNSSESSLDPPLVDAAGISR